MNPNKTVSKIGRELAGDMPQGSEHLKGPEPDSGAAPGGEQKPEPNKSKAGSAKKPEIDLKKYAHLKDKHGFAFDPKVHKTKAGGEPVIGKNNLLCRRPGRRPAESKSFVFQGAPAEGAPGEQPGPGTEAAHYAAAGQAMSATIFAVGQMLGGRDWAPKAVPEMGLDESAQMADAWAAYFRAKGVVDIPPGMAVSIACASYALPRFTLPSTQTRLGKLRDWWKNRKDKKPDKPPKQDKQETAGRKDG